MVNYIELSYFFLNILSYTAIDSNGSAYVVLSIVVCDQGDVARAPGQAAAPAPRPREGGRAIQILQTRRSKHQNQSHATVSQFNELQFLQNS